MKKVFVLSLLSMFLISGCTLIGDLNDAQSNEVAINVIEGEHLITDAKSSTTVNFEIGNGLSQSIYYDDFSCDNPVKVYQLINGNWEVREDVFSVCMGLAAGTNKPSELEEQTTRSLQKTITNIGTYKLKFEYYESKSDFENSENLKIVESNEFVVSKIETTVQAVYDSCQVADDRDGRITECLNVVAKNYVTTDLDFSLQLCQKIDEIGFGFDGCYQDLAYALKRNGETDKIETVCRYYQDEEKIQSCIDSAK